jgi:hypothetical protein
MANYGSASGASSLLHVICFQVGVRSQSLSPSISASSFLQQDRLLLGRVWKYWDPQTGWPCPLVFPVHHKTQGSVYFPQSLTHSDVIHWLKHLVSLGVPAGGPLKWVRTCPAHRLQSSLRPETTPGTQGREASKVSAGLMLTKYPWLAQPSTHIQHQLVWYGDKF